MNKVTLLIPVFNEEKGIASVIKNIPFEELEKIGLKLKVIVVDNNSTDKTVKIVEKNKIKILTQKSVGKGNALMTGFKALNGSDYVVIIDGDNTYKPEEIPRLLEPLKSGFCDVVAGSRISGKILNQSLSFSHRVFNWIFSFLVRHFYKANITDTLTGFIAFKRSVIHKLIPHLQSTDFAIEMEMFTKLARMGYQIYSVPITYDRRMGKSKLNSLTDGIKILHTFFKNLLWKPLS